VLFTLLFVCQANLCRSPMAERLARLRLARDGATGVEVMSAGTRALEGSPMHPVAMRVLAERGADPGEFTSRQVTEKVLDGADLVLTATRHQRAVCVSMVPEMVACTFTMRQFGRMLAAAARGESRADNAPNGPHGAHGLGAPDGPAGPGSPGGPGGPAGGLDGGPDALRDRLRRAVAARATLQPVAPEEDDLADPVREPVDAFRRCADAIEQVLDGVLGRLIAR
jgi:protein-tyrosine phosphatase